MFKNFKKIILVLLIAGMNANGLSAVFGTYSYFSDTQISPENFFRASTLDFSLISPVNFSPKVYPNAATSSRLIGLQNDGLLGFNYKVKSNNANGTLCDFLNLKATLGGVQIYDGALKSFDFTAGEFAVSTTGWQFTASLTSTDPALQNQACSFDFVFKGAQLEGAGFYDEETIANTITSDQWQKVVINKVYYDVCDKTDGSCGEYKGEEDKNEWIELYNPTNVAVDLQGWTIYNHNDNATIHNKFEIPALGYAILTHDATTEKYWEIPNNVLVSYQLGGQFIMNNDDMLVLKDGDSQIIDQMNWGTPDSTWTYYNSEVWPDGIDVMNAGEGYMLGRVPAGFDTDKPEDWKVLRLPQTAVFWPNGGETLHIGSSYDIKWEAVNFNGPNSDLRYDIWYSRNNGNTWGRIVAKIPGTENNGVYSYNWTVRLFTGDNNDYFTVSPNAKIKVVAYGPENFMVQGWDASDKKFCPPIDMSVLTQEEIDQAIAMGLIDIYGNILAQDGETENSGKAANGGKNQAEEMQNEETDDGAADETENGLEENQPEETASGITEEEGKEDSSTENEQEKNEPALKEEPVIEPEATPEQNQSSEPEIINEEETAGEEEASPETTPPSNPPPENNNTETGQQAADE